MDKPRSDGVQEGWQTVQEGFSLYQPGLPELAAFITPDQLLFRVTHMGVYEIDSADWCLTIDGLVQQPLQLSYADLAACPQTEVLATHECAGSPLNPTEPVRRVGTVSWRGVDLLYILQQAGVLPQASYMWSHGADWGSFGGSDLTTYQKDLSLEMVQRFRPLLATHVNGQPLSAERGGPVRLVVPECYGTNSTKWLTHLHFASQRAPGVFAAVLYNEEVDGELRPVWQIAPHAVFTSHHADMRVAAGLQQIRGWAWACGGVDLVEVSVDGGFDWLPAQLEARIDRAWQGFVLDWEATPGTHRLLCRARACDGRTQPAQGARNAWLMIEFEVE